MNALLTLLDVGASGGIDSRWNGYSKFLRAVLVEPDPRAAKQLKEDLGGASDNFVIIEKALGSSGEKKLHLCKRQEVSSLLKPNLGVLSRFPDPGRFDILEETQLSTLPLDRVLAEQDIVRVDFIKLDTQGSELDIVRSGPKTMTAVIGAEIEVEFIPLYENQPLFADVDAHMRSLGFELFDIKRCHWPRRHDVLQRKGQLVFGDALYLRPPEDPLLQYPEHALRAALIYSAYGYSDLVEAVRSRFAGLVVASELKELLHVRRREDQSRWLRKAARAIDRIRSRIPIDFQKTWDDTLGGD